jgi:hypothetical protein
METDGLPTPDTDRAAPAFMHRNPLTMNQNLLPEL